MPLFAQQSPDAIFWLAIVLAVAAFAAVWAAAIERRQRGLPIVPYRPRRPAPWGALDLAFVVLIYLIAQACVLVLASMYLPPEAMRTPDAFDPDKAGTTHATLQLMSGADAWVLLLCGFSAIVAAPLAEEFFFRALLQGWFETLERRLRRRMPVLRRLLPRAFAPVALTSLLFAMMHFRVEGPPVDGRFLLFMMAGNAAAGLLTMLIAIPALRWRVGATAADFGWSADAFFADAGLGLAAFAAVALPIYAVQLTLTLLMPKYVSADPVTLFLFAFVLGTVFFRTHRIVPAIVLHASLNATSFLLAWAGTP